MDGIIDLTNDDSHHEPKHKTLEIVKTADRRDVRESFGVDYPDWARMTVASTEPELRSRFQWLRKYDIDEMDDNHEDQVQVPKRYFLSLPREIRDEVSQDVFFALFVSARKCSHHFHRQIYKIVLKLDAMTDYESMFICLNRACALKPRANYKLAGHFKDVIEILATCRQIHNEGTKVSL